MAVAEIVQFAYQNPHMFELMRTASWRDTVGVGIAKWKSKNQELKNLMESIIRRGIASGDMVDPHPELTARFVAGMARAALMEPDQHIAPQTLTGHILRFIKAGLVPLNTAAAISPQRT